MDNYDIIRTRGDIIWSPFQDIPIDIVLCFVLIGLLLVHHFKVAETIILVSPGVYLQKTKWGTK